MSYNKETGLYEGYLYLITCKVNQKQYIGQTSTTVQKRFYEHLQKASIDINYFHNAILKYGKDNFSISIIDSVSSSNPDELQEILNKGEIYYIAKYNTIAPNGYNLTQGGGNTSTRLQKPVCQYGFNGSYISTFSSINDASEKLGINRKGITNCCNRNVSKNGKHSYSAGGYIWRFKGDADISDSLEYINRNEKRICKYNLENELVCVYDNINIAASDFKNSNPNGREKSISDIISEIRKCCNYYSVSYRGYKYIYEGQTVRNRKNAAQVKQYDLSGNIINTYKSITEAAIMTGIKGISACCRKEHNTSGGYIWRYIDDELTDADVKTATSREPINKIKISQYTKDGKYLHTYNSISDAALTVGNIQKSGNIGSCCKGKLKTAYGYKWFYANDLNQPDKTRIAS